MADTVVELAFEFGIKFEKHDSPFIYLGYIGLPVESMEDVNYPELIEAIQNASEEFIKENLIFVIRPLGENDDDEIL